MGHYSRLLRKVAAPSGKVLREAHERFSPSGVRRIVAGKDIKYPVERSCLRFSEKVGQYDRGRIPLRACSFYRRKVRESDGRKLPNLREALWRIGEKCCKFGDVESLQQRFA